jgi:hypothetical protein
MPWQVSKLHFLLSTFRFFFFFGERRFLHQIHPSVSIFISQHPLWSWFPILFGCDCFLVASARYGNVQMVTLDRLSRRHCWWKKMKLSPSVQNPYESK